jgi:magnesium transporter
MIRSLYFSSRTAVFRSDLTAEDWALALQDADGLLWVDFENTPAEADEPLLREVFGFHPLAIDDALQESHVPKVDDWGRYLYIVLHGVGLNREDLGEIETCELDIFLGANFLVTHHDCHLEAVERVWVGLQRDDRHLKNGPDYLLYRLADEVVAGYMPVVESLDDAIDQAEDQIFDRPTPRTLERIFALKRAALHLRRIIGPQREVLNKLARDDYGVIDAQARVYFRDVYDHLVRLHDISESIRDLVGGTLDTYLSVINNRMNEIMKTLTIITTLFMPLSFIAGFFGMNFFIPVAPITSLMSRFAFTVMLGLMFATSFLMWFWMRRRGWM